MSPLSFDNRRTDRNADYCVNTNDDKITTAKNLVNVGQPSVRRQSHSSKMANVTLVVFMGFTTSTFITTWLTF